MTKLQLFHVKDSDRPMYVVATTFALALDAWRAVIRLENNGDECGPPLGVDFVCETGDLLLPAPPDVIAVAAKLKTAEEHVLVMRCDRDEARKERDDAREELRSFKAYVHKRLDGAHVPENPQPPNHALDGRRIGDRLDWVFAELSEARSEVVAGRKRGAS